MIKRKILIWGFGLSLLFQEVFAQVTFNKVHDIDNGVEAAFSVVNTNDGYLFYGEGDEYFQFNNGWGAMALIKTDYDGNVLWQKQYGVSGQSWYSLNGSLRNFEADNYILSGTIYDSVRNQYDGLLIKFLNNGDTAFVRKYGDPVKTEYFHSNTVLGNAIYLFGSKSLTNTNLNYYLVKTDSLGNKLWEQTYGSNLLDEGFTIDNTLDGNLILGGGGVSA